MTCFQCKNRIKRFRRVSTRIFAIFTAILAVTCFTYTRAVAVTPKGATAVYAGGDGSQKNPYLIATAGQMVAFEQQVNGSGNNYNGIYFDLENDIDLSQYAWKPIGYTTAFQGAFDGNGHKITGVTIGTAASPDSVYSNCGFFGSITYYAVIENLSVNVSIHSKNDQSCVGGLVGAVSANAAVKNCSSSGVVTGIRDTGGLVGALYNSTTSVTGCSSSCTVTGDLTDSYGYNVGGLVGEAYGKLAYDSAAGSVTGGYYAMIGGLAGAVGGTTNENSFATGMVSGSTGSVSGGLIGAANGATIQNCYAEGSVESSSDAWGQNIAGGLIGDNEKGTSINNCYAANNVAVTTVDSDKGFDSVGGFAGRCSKATISNCYAAGSATAGTYAYTGGFIGSVETGASVRGGYWNITVNSIKSGEGSGDQSGVTGKVMADMQSPDFTTLLNGNITALALQGCAGWQLLSGKNGGLPVLNDTGEGDTTPPTFGTPVLSTTSPTNQSVFVSVPIIGGNVASVSCTFNDNGSKTLTASDSAGNTAQTTVSVTNIDRKPPTFGKPKFSPSGYTNKFVKATVPVIGGVVPSVSCIFYNIGSKTLKAANAAGNTASIKVTVSTIDYTPPTIVIRDSSKHQFWYYAKLSGGCAVITVSDSHLAARTLAFNNKKIAWPAGGKIKKPGYYYITATDKAGNKSVMSFKLD